MDEGRKRGSIGVFLRLLGGPKSVPLKVYLVMKSSYIKLAGWRGCCGRLGHVGC